MANEKMKDQNVGSDPNQGREHDKHDKGKAMGAGATGTQGQKGESFGRQSEFDQEGGSLGRQSESAGQGGGVQGTGQRNPNPTQGQTGQGTQRSGLRDEESTSKRKPDQEEY